MHDVCDPSPTVKVVSVTSNEPDNGTGDGDTVGDVAYSAGAICVRQERSGGGSGRTYTATVQASDAAGNTTQQQVTFQVPHDATGHCSSSGTPIGEGPGCQ